MAIQPGSRAQLGAQTYDVRVLAFPAATGHTVLGLMQLFGIDEAAAQRLIVSVPLLLSQQVSAPEAEAYAQALRKLGARVALEPCALAGTQTESWSEPSPYEEDLLPQPRPLTVSNSQTELEYDVLADMPEPALSPDARLGAGLRDPLDLELSLSEPDRMPEDAALRRPRNDAIDLQGDYGSHGGPGLELEAVRPAAQREHSEVKPAEPPRARPEAREPVGAQPAVAVRPRPAQGAPAHSRAAVVERRAPAQRESRTLPLLQLCFALGVLAVGYWADSSVIFGSASWWSIVAHGLALQQLILGIRGLSS